jgi:dTDP-4-amino-4,6-dideoxygalactose transaminase
MIWVSFGSKVRHYLNRCCALEMLGCGPNFWNVRGQTKFKPWSKPPICQTIAMTKILINDLSAHVSKNRKQIEQAIHRVLESGWLVLGSEVLRFEQSFSEYIGASDCIGVANGTDALELALRALGVGQGDSVATVANAGAYTTTALLAIGAVPWFMDVDRDTQSVTLSEVSKAIDRGVKAVVGTHLFGLAIPELGEISSLCQEKGVYFLEDCAQAHGAKSGAKSVGSFGDAACFSFYPTKNLGALGDGGAIVTSDRSLARQIRQIRQYGWEDKYLIGIDGGRNSRLDEIQAAILNEFLVQIDSWNARRRQIAGRYSSEIRHPEIWTPPSRQEEYVAHLYVIRSQNRDKLAQYLRSKGIACEIHYPVQDNLQPIFGDRYKAISLENTECLSKEILTIPCYPEMTDRQVSTVIEALNSWQP